MLRAPRKKTERSATGRSIPRRTSTCSTSTGHAGGSLSRPHASLREIPSGSTVLITGLPPKRSMASSVAFHVSTSRDQSSIGGPSGVAATIAFLALIVSQRQRVRRHPLRRRPRRRNRIAANDFKLPHCSRCWDRAGRTRAPIPSRYNAGRRWPPAASCAACR
jgi:hypothetical protein